MLIPVEFWEMNAAAREGEDEIFIKADNNENFKYESCLSRHQEKNAENSNPVYSSKNDENNDETSHLHKVRTIPESEDLQSSKQNAESLDKKSSVEIAGNFSNQKTSKAEKSKEEEQISESRFGKIESIDKFMTLHFNPFQVEEEFIAVNDFDSKDLEKRALDLDILDTSEAPVNYKYNRTQNQTTRGFWNKKKEGVEAQLEQAENEANNGGEEAIDSDDEESIPVTDLISRVRDIQF